MNTPEYDADKLMALMRQALIEVNRSPMGAAACALIAAKEIRNALPMYTGNLNPAWKHWMQVMKIIAARA